MNQMWQIAVLATLAICTSARAEDGGLVKALNARLEQVYGTIWSHNEADRFVSELYADDATGTMEGAPTVWRGRAQLTKLIAEFMHDYKLLRFHSDRIVSLGPRAASQFLTYEAVPNDPKAPTLYLKCLYAWTKTARGWRIASDMCANGAMNP
jgi:hypothetical protein